MSYLLDTNVVSEIRKTNPDPRVALWYSRTDSSDLNLSVLVVGEIRQGIDRLRRRGDRRQADALDLWLASLKGLFADRLLPISTAIAERLGRLNAESRVPEIDGLMAATAIEHDLTFVTRDARALAGIGVRVLDPWRA